MKKILIIAGALHIGGAEKVCRDIGLYAGTRCVIHYLVFGERIGDYEAQLIGAGCKVLHAAPPSEGHLAYYRYLKQLIRTEHYDAVHSHTMFNSGWAMVAAKRCKVPIRIAHSHSALDVPRSFYVRCYEAIMRRLILHNANVYAACGQKSGERLFGKKAFEREGKLLLNGINTDLFAYNEEARLRIRRECGVENRFVIGHAGHLAEVKNQSFLILLMPQIIERRPDAFLLLLGDGPDKEKLQGLISQLKLEAHVCLTGNVFNVDEYLSAMDVFAFPSLYEGLPLSIVEVQANGLPCIISDRVPKDVFITDLLTPLSLDDENAWVDALCSACRSNSKSFSEIVRNSGMDVQDLMRKIYSMYGV